MITVQAIYISPVKSLGLQQPKSVHVGSGGILEDRRFYLVNDLGRLLTQREIGRLVQIEAHYQVDPEQLCLRFPTGVIQEGPLDLGEAVLTKIWGRYVPGRAVTGEWNGILSEFCQLQVRLVRSDAPGSCFDEYPVSIISQASLEMLSQQPGASGSFDSRRFRPSLLLEGCQPHEEDAWLGNIIQVGPELRLRVVARDPRCAITTHDPTTGDRDVDTLRLILSYRPHPRAAYLGVYGVVEYPGQVSLGDPVTPLI